MIFGNITLEIQKFKTKNSEPRLGHRIEPKKTKYDEIQNLFPLHTFD